MIHLGFQPALRVGHKFRRGDVISYVAAPGANGGWWPHLHLQGLRSLDLLCGLDGYGPPSADNRELYPDPFGILGMV